jgi:hypothetical protein
MKALIQFVFPTIKAVFYVIGFIGSLSISAYMGLRTIAKAEAQVIEEKMMAVRNADYQHFNSRFDRSDAKLDKVLGILEEKK